MSYLSKEQAAELETAVFLVSEFTGVATRNIISRVRKQEYVFARALYYQYIKDNYGKSSDLYISGSKAMYFIDSSHGMQTYYKNLVKNDFTVNRMYALFKKFYKNRNDVGSMIEAQFGDHKELKEKLLFIKSLIEKRFKTKYFRQHHTDLLKAIVSVLDKNDPDNALIKLEGWFDSFAMEYYDSGSMQLITEFQLKGTDV